jgi:hypothetical protein
VALNTEFRADEEREAAEEDGDDALNFIEDLPDPKETAAEQRAILASYESAKKADDVAYARVEAEEQELRRALDLSVQRVPIEEAGCRLFMEERQRLLEDEAEHRALFTGIQRERRRVAVVMARY